ncbi:ralBP1-associated Eps domain-containing protein 1-like [Watersipora subatra]|uniref:ralBP1-associated Eps domain-containing protein 1-like n=1 Tax=Watersipora subatra TaxID=2589382 RepID=UPI00355BB713
MELNEQEQQLYEELFQRCDLGKTTKIPVLVAGELFSSSGLPAETSRKIAEMCGATRLGYFGRSQFYIALKFIAAAQQHITLNPDVVGATNLPLPSINRAVLNSQLQNHTYDVVTHNLNPDAPSVLVPPVQMHSSSSRVLPPPPTKKHVRNFSGTIQQSTVQGHPPQLPTSHLGATSHNNTSQPSERSIAPVAQGDTPTSSEANWASFPSPTKGGKPALSATANSSSPGEHIAAVATPLEAPASPDWNAGGSSCGVSKKSFNIDSCSLSSADYATSETSETTDDVWVINNEQREYYINQFTGMQSDLTSTIKGPVAKEFFERSKLSNNELSKIWKLSDVNRDGELTLQEFCTAMHLVVLRRNQVELPTTLPSSLMPYVPASSEPFSADLDEELQSRSPSPAGPSAQHQKSWPGTNADSSWSPNHQWSDKQGTGGSDQWHNPEQWQQTGSEVSGTWRPENSESGSPLASQWTGSSQSPTIKPIQFDAGPALIADTEIAVPVAVKVLPTPQHKLVNVAEDTPEGSALNVVRERSNTSENLLSNQSQPVRPRPTPKKAQSVGAAMTDPMLKYPPPQSLHGYQSLPGTTPTVPPRNQWSISSPDADLWAGESSLPPQTLDKDDTFPSGKDNDNFADFFTKFGEPKNEPFGEVSNDRGMLDIAHTTMQPVILPTVAQPRATITHEYSIRDKKEIQNSIRKQRERNEMLVRSSSELHSELQEVVEQRISLEIQLEHIKPC